MMGAKLRKSLFRLRCWLLLQLAGDMEVGINLIVADIYHDPTKPCFRKNVRVIKRSSHWMKIFAKSLWN